MKNPLVSVLMPAYNAEKYIGEAIESILSQTYKNFELIIIDDYSTDDTWKVIQEYQKKDKRISAFQNKRNLKLSHTLNKGIHESKGKYIARMDADDVSLADRLEKQVKFLEEHPQVGILGGVMEIVDHQGNYLSKRKYPVNDAEIRKKLFRYCPFSHPLIMLRKIVFDKSGLYNDEFNPAEDYELYFRIGEHTKFANLDDTLLQYRVVPKSMTTGGTKKMELQTVRARNIYGKKSTYNMSIIDKVYNNLHWLSVYIIPSRIKIILFNFFRNSP